MARHRSPSGAQADDPDRTTVIRVVTNAGALRLPAPPPASHCHRATVAAVAVGAVVAGTQTLIPPPEVDQLAPITVSAMLPVAEVTGTDAAPAFAVDAIGGDQLLPDTLAVGALDASTEVDVQSLAKAVDIGRELAQAAAREDSIISAALSGGAQEAHIVGDTAFVRPVIGRLTSVFGFRWGTSHDGIDVANSIGTPIYAVTDAVVEEAGPASGFGLWVVLRHSDGTQSVYGHVNRIFVEKGQRVEAGEEIAELGNRGRSTGPHLHMEVWDVDGTKINPLAWLEDRGIDY